MYELEGRLSESQLRARVDLKKLRLVSVHCCANEEVGLVDLETVLAFHAPDQRFEHQTDEVLNKSVFLFN